ncbi:MAG: hypothetical protein WCS37_21330, partial [Chloroflexota bacterium]
SNTALILSGHVNDVRAKSDYPIAAIKPFAVIHQSKHLERMEGLEEAKSLLKDNRIETLAEDEIPAIIQELKRNLEVKNYFMQQIIKGY